MIEREPKIHPDIEIWPITRRAFGGASSFPHDSEEMR